MQKIVGYRIKELRINKANLSQESFAQLLNMDRSYLSRIESGKINIRLDTLEQICKILDVSFKEFFEFMDNDHMENTYDKDRTSLK